MSEAVTVCRRLIYDKPAETDAFVGGGHARTADSLAKLIREFDGETRAIGVEGRWGSGKSSIVEMAKKRLEENPAQIKQIGRRAYYIFTYDLWAHQTGNFRRMFLEQLISWLKTQPESDKKRLNEIYDQITNRTIKTRTENTKTFSVFGLVALLFLLMLPLIYVWLSPFAFANKKIAEHGFVFWAITVVAAMAIFTLAKIIITWARGQTFRTPFQWWRGKKNSNSMHPVTFMDATSRTLSVFSKDAETTNIEQKIREIDPSQYEFEETLKEVVSYYQTNERRIIIVFDNVDRLPVDKIADAWANVRAVVSAARPFDGSARKIVLIVPYDREHILNAVKTANVNGGDPQDQEDLLRKSFDAILFVAPPVIADASKFFGQKLEEALGGQIDKETAYRVYKIFDISRRAAPPTPRQIIAFINAVSGLWEEWNGLITLPTVALFMTHRELLAREPSILRSPERIDERQRDLADNERLFEHLAALAYNVEPRYALQVLLHGPIEKLFTRKCTEEELNEITKSPGWDTILPDVYRENARLWAESSIVQYRNSVRNLVLLKAKNAEKLEGKRALLDGFKNLLKVPSSLWDDQSDLTTLYTICNLAEARTLTSDLSEWLERSLPQVEQRSFLDGRNWIDFIGSMHAALLPLYGESEAIRLISGVTFPIGDEFVVGVAYDVDRTEFHLKDLENVPLNKGLLAAMESRLIDAPGEFFYAWPELKHLLEDAQSNRFVETLGIYLRDNKIDDVERLRFFLSSYTTLIADGKKTEALAKSIRNLVNNGALYQHVHTIQNSDSEHADHALAALFWLILNQEKGRVPAAVDLQSHAFGNLNAPRDWVYNAIREGKVEGDVVGIMTALSQPNTKLSMWIGWAASAPGETGLIQDVIAATVRDGTYRAPSADVLTHNFDFLNALLAKDMEELLARVGKMRPVEEWTAIDPADLSLSLIAGNHMRQEAGWKALYLKIDEWLSSQDSDALKTSLIDETHVFSILRQRVEDGKVTLAPDKLRKAITEHFRSLVSGEISSKESFDAVWNAVPPNSRAGLAIDTLDHLARTVVTHAGIDVALACYPALMSQLPLAKRPDVAARRIVLPLVEAVLGGSEKAFQFLNDNKKYIRQSLKKLDDNLILGELKDTIEASSAGDGEITDRQRAIYDALGLNPPKRELGQTSDNQDT